MNSNMQEVLQMWNDLERTYIRTFSPYGRFDGNRFFINKELPQETIKKVNQKMREMLKEVQEFGQQIEKFCENHNRNIKPLNERVMKTRNKLLQIQKEGVELPDSIKQLYRLDENIK